MTYYVLYRINNKTGEGIELWQGSNWRMANDRKKWLTRSLQQLKMAEQYYITLEVKTLNE